MVKQEFDCAGGTCDRMSLAVHSKKVSEIIPENVIGLSSGMVIMPDDFDGTFRKAATPGPQAMTDEGLVFIDPDALNGDGAWTVRVLVDCAYIACQRHVTLDKTKPHLLGRPTALQTNYLEQVTFRVPVRNWQERPVDYLVSAQDWVKRNTGVALRETLKSGGSIQTSIVVPPSESSMIESSQSKVNLSNIRTGVKDPTVVIPSGLLPESDRGPLAALLALCSPEQLRRASFAYGYRTRFPNVSMQIFDSDKLSFSPDGVGSRDAVHWDAMYFEERQKLLKDPRLDNIAADNLMEAIGSTLFKTMTGYEDYKSLLEKMEKFELGRSRDMSNFTKEEVIMAAYFFEAAMDVWMSRHKAPAWLAERYSGFVQSTIVNVGKDVPEILRRVSGLEFFPSVLTNLPLNHRGLFIPVLRTIVAMQKYDNTAYMIITARTTSQDYSESTLWRHLVDNRRQGGALIQEQHHPAL